jgi:hypothetical protein
MDYLKTLARVRNGQRAATLIRAFEMSVSFSLASTLGNVEHMRQTEMVARSLETCTDPREVRRRVRRWMLPANVGPDRVCTRCDARNCVEGERHNCNEVR